MINVATYIGNKFTVAITPANAYNSVEFFAVPTPAAAAPFITAKWTDFTDANADKTMIMTINTTTVDQAQ